LQYRIIFVVTGLKTIIIPVLKKRLSQIYTKNNY
jgi:hypothetical protein